MLLGDNTGDSAVMMEPIGFWCVGFLDLISDFLLYTHILNHILLISLLDT
jgi:hypothetical protein